jgi:hypothetical protein
MAELRLIPLCTIAGEIKKPNVVGKGAGLVQENFPVLGSIDGERLNGKMQGESHYDWMSGPGGIGTLQVVANIQTDDGASISVRYEARADISNGFEGVVGYAAPVFTTSHPGYLWLNLIQAVGRGPIQGDHIYWDWYQVAEAGL